jgi:hypothetical protein
MNEPFWIHTRTSKTNTACDFGRKTKFYLYLVLHPITATTSTTTMATIISLLAQQSCFHRHLRQLPSVHAFFSTAASSKPSNSTTWERSAKRVKNTDVTNPYLDKIRAETVDPSLQIKTIEDELCGAIGKALGKQGDKVLHAIREMKEEHVRYNECIEHKQFDAALEFANRHNEARKRALKARWELLVHRQAVGFTVDNHSVVHATFPINDNLPDTLDALERVYGLCNSLNETSNFESKSVDATPQKFGDQLDWWKRIGRWK